MKKTKIIIPALGMLLLSTAASVTGTVAWFAMNNTVSATGMQVTAKTDAVFLEIKGSEDANYGATGTNALNAQLFPVAHESWSALANIEDFDLNDDEANDNWFYRYSDDSGAANSNVTAKTYIGAFTDYVAKTTYSLQLKAGSQDTAYDLFVSSITIPANKGISVVIAGTTGYKEFSASATPSYAAADVISDTVTTTAQTISVYIYFNGADANVYSDNIAALTGQVSFQLTASAADHA